MQPTRDCSTDDRLVLARVTQGVVELLAESGLHLPLSQAGPGQYLLGSSRASVRLVQGKLMVRSGAGHVPFLDWLAKQPLPTGPAGLMSAESL